MHFTRQQTTHHNFKIIAELESATSYSKFTPFVDEMIRRYYPIKKTADVAKALGLTYTEVKGRANTLGIRKDRGSI